MCNADAFWFGTLELCTIFKLHFISFRFVSSSHHRFCVRLYFYLWEIVTSLSIQTVNFIYASMYSKWYYYVVMIQFACILHIASMQWIFSVIGRANHACKHTRTQVYMYSTNKWEIDCCCNSITWCTTFRHQHEYE